MAFQVKISDINALIEKIFSSKNEIFYSDYYLIKVSFELSNIQNESFYSLAEAVSTVLFKYNIELLKVIHKNIVDSKEGEYNFTFPALEAGLTLRNVSIILNFYKIRIIITGSEPFKGLNSEIKYFFDWNKCKNFDKKKEVTDLYEVCKLPQIKKDDLIATIFEPVKSAPGVDVYGARIPSRPVNDINVKFTDVCFERYLQPETQRFVIDVRAEKNGVLLCEFRKKRLTDIITKVYIWDKIKLRDIEINKYFFKTKPIKLSCAPEIEIQGNLSGNIIFNCEDNIAVTGTVDCLEINAGNNVKANIVRNTKINANKVVDINTVNNSEIISKQAIRVYRNLLNSILRSHLVVVNSKVISYILCTNSDIYANQLIMKGISVRNKFIIILGHDLFNKINKFNSDMEKTKKEINEVLCEIQTKINLLFEKIKNFSFVKSDSGLTILDDLHFILNAILRENISNKIKEDLINWIQHNNIDFYNIAKSCMSLISLMERHINLKLFIEDINESISMLSGELKGIKAVIAGEVTGNGVLIIKCDKDVMELDNVGKLNLSLVYDAEKQKLVTIN